MILMRLLKKQDSKIVFFNYLVRGGREHAQEGRGGAPKTELRITLYSNGFTIDNGEFRDYNDP